MNNEIILNSAISSETLYSGTLYSGTLYSGTIVWQNPEMLWLLPLMVSMVLFCRWLKCSSDQNGYSINPPQQLLTVIFPLRMLLPTKAVSSPRYRWRALSSWLIFSLLVLCLANPVRIGAQLPARTPQQNFTFVVDTSVSMLLKDYEVQGKVIDRMSMLKAVLLEFARELSGNRVSVVVFGNTVDTLVPFTQDQDLLSRMIIRIETGMAGRLNAVGDAIVYAVTKATEQSNGHSTLVLFTDMNESAGTASIESAVQLAAKHKLPLYTVAIGAANSTAPQTQQAKSAGLIYGPVNLSALKSMAEHTGASAYHARDVSSLKQAVADIAQREKPVSSPPLYTQQPLYPVPLLSILVLLTLRQWAGLFSRQGR